MQQYILKPEDLRILIYKQKSFFIAYFQVSSKVISIRYINFFGTQYI